MAMNSSNYGYPPSGYSTPYSSTPTGMRTQRPRFGYSGPSLYPRPRSSASKPNPGSYSDSMINNYGNSTSRLDMTFNSQNGNSFNDYHDTSGSNYYTANESFYSSDLSRNDSFSMGGDAGLLRNNSDMMRNDTGMRDNTMMYGDTNVRNNTGMLRGDKSIACGDTYNANILPEPMSQYGQPKYFHNNSFGQNNSKGEYKGGFQKNSAHQFGVTDKNNKASFAARKFGKAKRKMTTKQGAWRCDLCSLDFTSQIPYDMHVRGARHAKKLKAREALNAVQSQVVTGVDGEKGFFCELCNVKANSSLQLQTHLEGNKHKNKLQPKEPKEQSENSTKNSQEDSKKNSQEEDSTTKDSNEPVNGKTNGSLTRPLPSDFGEPQPAKLVKFACDICSISMNSEIQLQQHLTSKKHQNKVEGKPVIKGRKNKMQENKDTEADAAATNEDSANVEQASNETSKMVLGVKTLASSFVQGGTLQ